MTKKQLIEIFNIGTQYNEDMKDYGISSPADLVMKRMPELFNPIDEEKLSELAYECTPRILKEEGDIGEFIWGFNIGYRKAKEE